MPRFRRSKSMQCSFTQASKGIKFLSSGSALTSCGADANVRKFRCALAVCTHTTPWSTALLELQLLSIAKTSNSHIPTLRYVLCDRLALLCFHVLQNGRSPLCCVLIPVLTKIVGASTSPRLPVECTSDQKRQGVSGRIPQMRLYFTRPRAVESTHAGYSSGP